jgi:hypothetical protein
MVPTKFCQISATSDPKLPQLRQFPQLDNLVLKCSCLPTVRVASFPAPSTIHLTAHNAFAKYECRQYKPSPRSNQPNKSLYTDGIPTVVKHLRPVNQFHHQPRILPIRHGMCGRGTSRMTRSVFRLPAWASRFNRKGYPGCSVAEIGHIPPERLLHLWVSTEPAITAR